MAKHKLEELDNKGLERRLRHMRKRQIDRRKKYESLRRKWRQEQCS